MTEIDISYRGPIGDLLNQGREQTANGCYREAVDHYLQIYSYKFTAVYKLSPKNEMVLLNELGLAMRRVHDYTGAESAFTKALATAERENANHLMRILTTRAIVYERLEKYEEARIDQIEAFVGFTELHNKRGQGNAAIALGNLAIRREDWENAKWWFKTALAATKSGPGYNQTIADLAQNALMSLGPHLDKETVPLGSEN